MNDSLTGSVLVIEADNLHRKHLVEWLLADGFKVHAAASVDTGFALACNLKPSLILGDVVLALANGSQLLRALLRELPETSVIVITESASLNEAVTALQEGASDFLIKSMLNDDILRVSVQRAIERRVLREQNNSYRAQLELANQRLEESLNLLEYDQQSGRQVQLRLLPPTPHHTNGLEINHYLQPSLFLSGDFVDYFSVGAGRTAFYLADVSGHGASSAFVTVFLKTLTNRIRRHYEKRTSSATLSPGRIMTSMNEELRMLATGKHLTVFCGVIDTNTDQLIYSIGGHYPPAMLKNGNELIVLPGNGKPLGLFPDVHYEEHTLQLAPSFSLVALSDGILEVMTEPDLVSKEARIQAAVEAANGQWAVLKAQLGVETMSDVPDDIAVLMIKRDQ